MTCCSLVIIYRVFFFSLMMVAGGLTYYTYDWQRFTNKTLIDVQKVRAFGIVGAAFSFAQKIETAVIGDVSSFANTLDSISMNTSDPYDVLLNLPVPFKAALLSPALSPTAFLNQRVSYIYNDSTTPRGYLAVGCSLVTSVFPAYVAALGCSTNASLTTGSYNSTLYNLNSGSAPTATALSYNPGGAIERDTYLARPNATFQGIRANNMSLMCLTYYFVDYLVVDRSIARIRGHDVTTESWNAVLLSLRRDMNFHHDFLVMLTPDNVIVSTDYVPYITWQSECEVQYAAEGKDPLDCALIPVQNLPDTLLSIITLRGTQLIATAPPYTSGNTHVEAIVVVDEEIDDQLGDGKETFIIGFANGPAGLKIVAVLHTTNFASREILMYIVLWIPLGSVAFGLVFVIRCVFQEPISLYSDAMEDITQLDLVAVAAKLKDDTWIKRVALRFRELKKLNDHFITMNRSMEMFTAYVPKGVVKDMMIAETMGSREMDVRQLTVMFADIENFTTICESVDISDLSPVLDMYFGTMSRILLSHACTIDKFIGDAIMGFWGAPLMHRYQAFSCCCASLHMQHAVRTILAPHFQQLGFSLVVRIGCHMGFASVGNVGCAERMSYTALGDTVNISARLEGMNKRYETRVLVSQSIAFDDDVHNFVFRQLEGVVLKGRTEPMQTFELVGINGKHKSHPMISSISEKGLMSSESTFGKVKNGSLRSRSLGEKASLGTSSKYELNNSMTGAIELHDDDDTFVLAVSQDHDQQDRESSSSPTEGGGTAPARTRSHSNVKSYHRSQSRLISMAAPSTGSVIDKVSEMTLKDELDSVGREHILSERAVQAIHRLNSAIMAGEDAASPEDLRTAATLLETVLSEENGELSALGLSLVNIHRRIEDLNKLAEEGYTEAATGLVYRADFK